MPLFPRPISTRAALTTDERKIYDLICRRLLMAWHDDHLWAVTTLITAITRCPRKQAGTRPLIDRYHSSGTAVEQVGWKILEINAPIPRRKNPRASARPRRPGAEKTAEDEAEQTLPPGLTVGQPQRVLEARAVAKQTRPPPRLTEATLLTAMETAGRIWRTRNCRRR
jgi:DNA topoisomerase-3